MAIPSVSTGFARPVQEDSPHLSEFPEGITINFVSAADVAALVQLAVVDQSLRGRVIELGGTDNISFNQLAALLQQAVGRPASVGHIPRVILRAMATVLRPFTPGLARHARAALVMDTREMAFDGLPTRRAFPDLPTTDLVRAIEQYVRTRHNAVHSRG